MKRLILIAAVACNRGPHVPAAELPEAVCVEANNGQTVAVSGFLAIPGVMFGCQDDCRLAIASSKGSHDGVLAWFSVGHGANQIDAIQTNGNLATTGAKPTSDDDIRVHPDSGKTVLGVGSAIRASGQLWLSHERGKTTCTMSVDTIDANDGTPAPVVPRAASMVFVDIDPIIDRPNRAIIRRIARADLLAHGVASRFVDRETDSFFFSGSLRHGQLGSPPEWWPASLAAAWTNGVATCKATTAPGDCAYDLQKTLWDQWLQTNKASRFVYITQSGGESFVPGEPTVHVVDQPASTTETREEQLGKLVRSLASGAGTVHERLHDKAKPKDVTDNPLYIDLGSDETPPK